MSKYFDSASMSDWWIAPPQPKEKVSPPPKPAATIQGTRVAQYHKCRKVKTHKTIGDAAWVACVDRRVLQRAIENKAELNGFKWKYAA